MRSMNNIERNRQKINNDPWAFLWVDKLTLIFSVTIMLLSTLIIYINYFFWHYPPVSYFANGIANITCFLLFSFLGSFFGLGLSSRFTQTFFYVLVYKLLIYVVLCATSAVQLTPFDPIDKPLLQLDRLLQYDAVIMLDLLSQHKWIYKQLSHAYNFVFLELLILPILLMIAGQFYSIKHFFYFFISTTLIGFSFYFFWPTMAPASVLKSAYFLKEQHNTGIKFAQIHHHVHAVSHSGGLISMPSFHIIWALIAQHSTRYIKWLWWGLLPMNILVILAAIFLGWHYLVDFFGSVLVIALAWGLLKIKKT